jgi:putative heme iron utilization protein
MYRFRHTKINNNNNHHHKHFPSPFLTPQLVSSSSPPKTNTNNNKGHQLPEYLKERRGSAQTFVTQAGIHQPSDAEKSRTLLAKVSTATLSTIHAELDAPFGSIINFAITPQDNQIIFFASRLAEHTTNLQKHNRASILVSEPSGSGDRLAVARVTVVGECSIIPKTTELMQFFRTRHPNAVYVTFDDFVCFAFTKIIRVRYIGGFGSMSWVTSQDFSKAEPDPVALAPSTAYALSHMNDDHKDSLLSIVKKFGGVPDATACTLLSIDRYGIELLSETPSGRRRSRAAYLDGLILKDPGQVQHAIVALSKKSKETGNSSSKL